MRVLFYNHTAHVSGAERVLLMALRLLDKQVVQPIAACPEGELSFEIKRLGIEVTSVPELTSRFTLRPDRLIAGLFSLLRSVRQLRKKVRSAQVDAVHANSVRAGIAALFATAGMGHDVFWHVHDELKPHPISTAIRILARSSRRCRVIAVSEATASSFIGHQTDGSETRVAVIHNGVDIDEIDRLAGGNGLRSELRIASQSFLFGIVGQVTPRKGQLELIRVFAEHSKLMPSAKLLIVGRPIFNNDSLYYAKVQDEVIRLNCSDQVFFLGHRSDALSVIGQLDTLVVNSNSEAFVMVAIEAMAARTPVIATNVGGTREMIQNGVNGWLIEHGDDEQLANALVSAYTEQDARQLFAERSRTIVEESLNASRFIKEFQNTLLSAEMAETRSRVLGRPVPEAACENK